MKARILIVDDNVSLTTLLAKTLARFGYDAYTENSSVMAFSTIQKLMPDVILLDVMMPEKDGGKVLAEITSDLSTSKIPVILLTGLALEAQGLARMFGLTSQVIGKPVELKVLLSEIESQLALGRSYNEQRSHDRDQLQEQQLIQQLENISDPQPASSADTIPVEGSVSQQQLHNPFFTGDAGSAPLAPPAQIQQENKATGRHHSQPDFKGMFSNLPPLEPRSSFGPRVDTTDPGFSGAQPSEERALPAEGRWKNS